MAVAKPLPVPAPFMGENSRDGIASLKPAEARYLVNWEPKGNAVKPRAGYASFSTGGASAAVKTLAVWNGPASSQLIGVNGGSVYDFSSTSAASVATPAFTDSRFQTVCTGGYLIGVNGADTAWSYDGTTFNSDAGFTGVTQANLINIAKVGTRLWFCEKDKAWAWYSSAGGVTGALTKFDLSQVVGGGYCMAIGSHSQDAGNGPAAYTVFVMSTGEVAMYSGDPASTFTKVGSYSMPPPVGRQCLVSIGGQLAVVTTMGLVPVSAAVSGVAFDIMALGNFGKVAPSIQTDVASYGTLAGWQAIFHDGRVIINIPILSNASMKQRVYNTLTGAWTEWLNIDASCFAEWAGTLYFGSWTAGTVYEVTGTTDAGSAITLRARQAFLAMGGQRFKSTAIRFDMAVDGSVSGSFGIDLDYVQRPITIPSVAIATSYATTPWSSAWGSDWSSSNQYKGKWFNTYGEGRALGLALEASGTVTALEWYGSTLLAQPCGTL